MVVRNSFHFFSSSFDALNILSVEANIFLELVNVSVISSCVAAMDCRTDVGEEGHVCFVSLGVGVHVELFAGCATGSTVVFVRLFLML